MCTKQTTMREKEKKLNRLFNPVNISSFLYTHTHTPSHHLLLHARMVPFAFNSNRAKNEMRKQSRARMYVVSFTFIARRRFAPLHHLTRFLLLLSIIIVASHRALVRFLLLLPSSSILARFRFSSPILHLLLLRFIHSFISLMNRIVTTAR